MHFTSESSTYSMEDMAQSQCVDVGTSTEFIVTYDQKSQTDYTTDAAITRLTKALQTAQRAYIMIIRDHYGPSIMSGMNINNDEELDYMFNKVHERVNRIKNLSDNSLNAPLINHDKKHLPKDELNCQKVTKTYNRKRKLNYDERSNSNETISPIGANDKRNNSAIAEVFSSIQIKSPNINRNSNDCEPSTSTGRRSQTKTEIKYNNTRHSNNPDSQNMVPLGSGQTVIKRSQYEQINWTSYTMATRQLLLAVFPRSVLASHSLTGKRSPAFQHLPPKTCLDQRKVTDIIKTVTKMCNVKENLVRAAITVKCADENKMKKQKEKKKAGSNSLNLSNDSNSDNYESWDSDQENRQTRTDN